MKQISLLFHIYAHTLVIYNSITLHMWVYITIQHGNESPTDVVSVNMHFFLTQPLSEIKELQKLPFSPNLSLKQMTEDEAICHHCANVMWAVYQTDRDTETDRHFNFYLWEHFHLHNPSQAPHTYQTECPHSKMMSSHLHEHNPTHTHTHTSQSIQCKGVKSLKMCKLNPACEACEIRSITGTSPTHQYKSVARHFHYLFFFFFF